MSKINIVRSIRTKNNYEQEFKSKKEVGWDNRFHLTKSQIYDPIQDTYGKITTKNLKKLKKLVNNMKILREQFKQMEKSYLRPMKRGNCQNEKKSNFSQNNRNETYIENNFNLQGSYNKNNSGIFQNYMYRENINDPFFEEFTNIKMLWEDLGVTDNYRIIFENLSRDIDPIMRQYLFEHENNSLGKFSELLIKLSKEIETRESLIEKLHQLNQMFLNCEDKAEILAILITNLKNSRICSLNIINYIIKIREVCSYNVLGGKFNLDNLNNFYKFDKNYLIKMKFDMDFLVNSKLSTYFEFEPCEADPFLYFFYFRNSDMENVHKMQISEELLPQVKHGQYLILQDLIYFNINSVYMKNLKKEKEAKGKIKGIYGKDFSQPPFRNKKVSINELTQRLYSPPKKSIERSGMTALSSDFHSHSKKNNNSQMGSINGNSKKDSNFYSSQNNFSKTARELNINNNSNNYQNPLQGSGNKSNITASEVNNNHQGINYNNLNNNNNNNKNIDPNLSNNNLNLQQIKMLQDIYQNQNQFNLNNNQNQNPNSNIDSKLNNNFNNNFPPQNFFPQINQNPELLQQQQPVFINPYNFAIIPLNTYIPNLNNNNNNTNFNNLKVSASNNINYFPNENFNKSSKKSEKSQDNNSKIRKEKIKIKEIIAIDKKSSRENSEYPKEEEQDFSERNNNNKEKSIKLLNEIEEDLSIEDDIEIKNLEKNLTPKKFIKYENLKTESDIQEDYENDYHDDNKKSTKRISTGNLNYINKEKSITNNNNYSEENNENISEEISISKEKNSLLKLKNSLDELEDNKENSINELIDTESLKEIENEINTDFRNDQPVIEESKKSLDNKENKNPGSSQSLHTKSSKLTSEKLEIIDEESMEKTKSKSNILLKDSKKKEKKPEKEFYNEHNENKSNKSVTEKYETLSKGADNEYEDKFYDENEDSKIQEYNKMRKSENQQETFNSLESIIGVKTVTLQREKLTSVSERNKIESENTNNNNKNEENNEEESKNVKIEESFGNDYPLNDYSELSASRVSKYSTESKRYKAANKVSRKMFNEILITTKKAELNINDEVVIKTEKTEQNYDYNFCGNSNKSITNIDEFIENENENENNNEYLNKEDENKNTVEVEVENEIEEECNKNDKENKENEKIEEDPEIKIIENEENEEIIEEENLQRNFDVKEENEENLKEENEENLKEENEENLKEENEENLKEDKNLITQESKINTNPNPNNLITTENEKESVIKKAENLNFEDLKAQLKIENINEDILNFDKKYVEYIQQIPEELKITFNPKNSLVDYLSNFNPKFFKISKKDSENIEGIFIISYDSCEDNIKININHISFLNFEFFEEFFTLILSHINKTFIANELFIELFYEKKNNEDNFVINSYIRDTLKNKFHFKWNKLENKKGQRIQKLSMLIKDNDNNENQIEINKIKSFVNSPLEVNFYNILNIKENINKENEENLEENNDNKFEDFKNLNYLSIVSAISNLTNKDYLIKGGIIENYDKEILKKLSKNFISNVSQEELISDKEKNSNLKEKIPSDVYNKFLTESEFIRKNISSMNLNIKFSFMNSCKLNGYKYNRINCSTTILLNEELNHKFYILLSNCGNYSILITEVKDKLEDFIQENHKENIYKLFDKLYTNLKSENNQNDAVCEGKSIWIPCFDLKNSFDFNFNNTNNNIENDNNNNNLIDEIKKISIEDNEKEKNFSINNIEQCFDMAFKSNDNENNLQITFDEEKDILIKEKFLMAVINLDVLADSQISTVILNVINKESWQRVE